jgi:antirestriction protein ArdC
MNTPTKSTFSIAKVVTDEVLAALRSGNELPWIQPWRTAGIGAPYNPITKTEYRGINFLMLKLRNIGTDAMFMTAKQAFAKGGTPKKGKAQSVVFYNFIEKEESNASGGVSKVRFPVMKYYNVWNLKDIEGGNFDFKLPPRNIVINDLAEQMLSASEVTVTSGDFNAYREESNQIVLRNRQDFMNDDLYYGAMFHQLLHSTKKPLKRMVGNNAEGEALEYMVAELGASMLCAYAGIDGYRTEHTAGYIQRWIVALESNEKFVVMAAQRAQKAVDYLLARSYEQTGTPDTIDTQEPELLAA